MRQQRDAPTTNRCWNRNQIHQRSIRLLSRRKNSMTHSNFANYYNSGTLLTFSNGYTISIQWGPGTYSNHHNSPEYDGNDPNSFINWFSSPWQANNKEYSDHIKECKKVNRHSDKRHTLCFIPESLAKGWHSRTAEVAVWTESRGERNWKNLDTLQPAHDKYLPDDIAPTDTKGWLTTDEVAKLIHTVSSIQVKGNRIWDRIKIW